jgi:hypothetical protein
VKAIVTFTVIDLTGIHNIDVNFCNCDSKVERRQQLMRVCWWPATVRDPQTCATFGVLRLFQILNCLGKVSAHDFLRSLELLTNNDGLEPPAVRCSVGSGFKMLTERLHLGSSASIPSHCAAIPDDADDETRREGT